MAKKHYFYDCTRIGLRAKLSEKEETTCKFCLEKLGLYEINRDAWEKNTTNVKNRFNQQDANYAKWEKLRKIKKEFYLRWQ